MRADQPPQGSDAAVTQAAQAAQARRVELAREAQQARADAEMARAEAEIARARADRAQAVDEIAAAHAEGQLRDVKVVRGPDGHTMVTLPDGRTITIDASAAGPSPVDLLHEAGVSVPPPRAEREADTFARAGLAGALVCVLLALVWGIARATARGAAARSAAREVGPALDARLLRIEQAVESIAIEVERVSEAQRFSARLLAERGGIAPPMARRDTPVSGTPLS